MTDYFIAYALSRLLYFDSPTEEQKAGAIKKFQRDLGKQQTGELTFGQFNELLKRSEQTTHNPVYAPGLGDKIFVHIDSNFANAEGTWILEEEKIYYSINFSKIERLCIGNRANFDKLLSSYG